MSLGFQLCECSVAKDVLETRGKIVAYVCVFVCVCVCVCVQINLAF